MLIRQLKTVEWEAFRYCSYLEEISFGNNSQLTTIGDFAFNINPFEEITIPTSVTTIGEGAFDANLTDVYYAGTADDWAAINISSHSNTLTNATIHFKSTGPSN